MNSYSNSSVGQNQRQECNGNEKKISASLLVFEYTKLHIVCCETKQSTYVSGIYKEVEGA